MLPTLDSDRLGPFKLSSDVTEKSYQIIVEAMKRQSIEDAAAIPVEYPLDLGRNKEVHMKMAVLCIS